MRRRAMTRRQTAASLAGDGAGRTGVRVDSVTGGERHERDGEHTSRAASRHARTSDELERIDIMGVAGVKPGTAVLSESR